MEKMRNRFCLKNSKNVTFINPLTPLTHSLNCEPASDFCFKGHCIRENRIPILQTANILHIFQFLFELLGIFA